MLKHICNYPGCTNLVDIGKCYCQVHEGCGKRRQAEYDQAVRLRRDAQYHSFYLSKEWKQMKARVKSEYHGLCLWNYYHGKIKGMEEIHHIVSIKEDWNKRMDFDNLIPLTHFAHMEIEAKYKKDKAGTQKELRSMLGQWKKEIGVGGYEKSTKQSAGNRKRPFSTQKIPK